MKEIESSNQKMGVKPFLLAAVGWLVLSQVVCHFAASDSEQFVLFSRWSLVFWILSVFDLGVLAKLVSAAFSWMNSSPEMRPAHAVQTLCWGLFKVICLGLFIIVLLKGQKIPMYGLLTGMGTLVIVPLIGGFAWSQRVLSNA